MSYEMVTHKVTGKIAELVREWIRAKKDESAATNRRKAAEQLLIPEAQKIHLGRCRRDGQVHPGIRLDAGAAGQVDMVQPPRYRKTDSSEEQDLRGLFGDDDFGKYFRSKVWISIDVEKLTDEQAEGIFRALGAEACCELLTAESVIEPTEQYHRDRILDSRIAGLAAVAERQGLAVPFSPAFRPDEPGVWPIGPATWVPVGAGECEKVGNQLVSPCVGDQLRYT